MPLCISYTKCGVWGGNAYKDAPAPLAELQVFPLSPASYLNHNYSNSHVWGTSYMPGAGLANSQASSH